MFNQSILKRKIMKKNLLLKYVISPVVVNLLFTSTLFATQKDDCIFYNKQYDKYEKLVNNTPDVFASKQEFIKKLDFYDMQIFHDDKCDLKKSNESINDFDITDSLING